MSPLKGLLARIGGIVLACCAGSALSADNVITLGAAVSLTGKYVSNVDGKYVVVAPDKWRAKEPVIAHRRY